MIDLDEYIVTIGRNTPTLNFERLRRAGVSGVIVEAGCLFTASHTKQKYKNPKLDSQIARCNEYNMPYGLYTEVKSRSVSEANEEIQGLTMQIRKYPPLLGVWLKLGFTKSVTTNNSILDTYYHALYKLGLKDRMGIYATRAQMQKITWDNYFNSWYLWLIDHVDSTSEMTAQVTPAFFKL